MKKHHPFLEWQIADECGLDEDAWLMAQSIAPPERQRRCWRRFLKELILCAMVVAVIVWNFSRQHASTTTASNAAVQPQVIITTGSPSILGGLVAAIDTAPSRATLTTQYFVFSLLVKDAVAVKADLVGIDQLYVELRQKFGLEPPGMDRKRAIAVAVTNKAGTAYPTVPSEQLSLPPAIFAGRPISPGANTDREAYLRQWLSAVVVREVARYAEVKIFWMPLMTGLQLAIDPHRADDAKKRRLLEQAGPWSLTQTQTLPPELMPYYWDQSALGAQLLADYIVVTYSCRQIAALIAGFHEHDSWETLSPAVFDIPASVLEADWHTSLANRDAHTAGQDNEPASLACAPVP